MRFKTAVLKIKTYFASKFVHLITEMKELTYTNSDNNKIFGELVW